MAFEACRNTSVGFADSSPSGEPFGAVQARHIKPALKGVVDMSVSEWTEGL